MLEDNQMIYYVALNGFLLFNSWGLNKSWKEDPADYLKSKTCQLILLSTPINSCRTVPLNY
jgi:hypothetical protein